MSKPHDLTFLILTHGPYDKRCPVNIALVEFLRPLETSTELWMASGAKIIVKESVDEIFDKLQALCVPLRKPRTSWETRETR